MHAQVLGKLGFSSGKKISRSHLVIEKGGKVLDVQYGITPKNSVKDAVEFCLANKGEALPGAESAPAADEEEAAEQAEEAAAAGEEAEKKEQEAAAEEVGCYTCTGLCLHLVQSCMVSVSHAWASCSACK
jgi:hypothetical protein